MLSGHTVHNACNSLLCMQLATSPEKLTIRQGPLKKWTEHSQELHLLKIHTRYLIAKIKK